MKNSAGVDKAPRKRITKRELLTIGMLAYPLTNLLAAVAFNLYQFSQNAEAISHAESDDLSLRVSEIASRMASKSIKVACRDGDLHNSVLEKGDPDLLGSVWGYHYLDLKLELSPLPSSVQPDVVQLRSYYCKIIAYDQSDEEKNMDFRIHSAFSYLLLAHELAHLTHPKLNENDTQCEAVETLRKMLENVGYSDIDADHMTAYANYIAEKELSRKYYANPCEI